MKRLAVVLAASVSLVGLNVVTAPAPAHAAGCRTPYVYMFKGYNDNCTWAQHYQESATGTRHYGNRVSTHEWSSEMSCYADTVRGRMASSGVATSAI